MIWHYSQQQARHWHESAKSLFTKYTLIQERMIEWKMMTLGWDGYLPFPRLVGVLGMGGSGGCLLELVVMCHRGCAVVPGSLLAGVPFGLRVCSLPCAVALLSGCPWRIYGSAGFFPHTSCWCFGFLAFAIDCDHLGFLGACGFSLCLDIWTLVIRVISMRDDVSSQDSLPHCLVLSVLVFSSLIKCLVLCDIILKSESLHRPSVWYEKPFKW